MLSRQVEQTIMIGDTIEVKVVEIRGKHVKLGVEAPRTVPVHRREVYDSIKKARTERISQTGPHAI